MGGGAVPLTRNPALFDALLSDDLAPVALALAELEVPVFPAHGVDAAGRCSCGGGCGRAAGKHPRTRRGLLDASTLADQVRHWWSRWPNANPAAATGAAAGIWVLDADAGAGGLDALEALEEKHGEIAPTWAVETGGGGLHLWFAHPGGRVPSSVGKLGPGLDVRGEGGYVICPPSSHRSGGRYRWADDWRPGVASLALAPAWLLDLARSASAAKMVPPAAPRIDGGGGGNHPGADGGPIPEGRRNATLASSGGAMRRRGFGEPAILAALLAENAARCVPPLPETEVARIARSIARYLPGPTPARPSSRERVGGFVEFVGGKAVRR